MRTCLKLLTGVLALGAVVALSGCYTRTIVVYDHHDTPQRDPEPEPTRDPDPEPEVVEIEVSYYHDSLHPFGTWIYIEGYGDCWYPNDVDDDWRPYSHGHWVWVDDCGWYWVSDYEWGWACEHYGRWTYYSGHWCWVPGYEWSGGWVVWYEGGGYIGWAALPPTIIWDDRDGCHDRGVRWEIEIRDSCWVWVSHGKFYSRHIHQVCEHPRQNRTRFGNASYRGCLGAERGRPMNRAIGYDDAERYTGQKGPRRKVKDQKDDKGRPDNRDDGESVIVFRPKVKKNKPDNDKEEREKKEREEKEKLEKEKADR
ncbi:MAG: hypothetical protein KDB90_14805, partial [Planctomycetes bacterium]|nr:hypothetical protein [Planctomycetota bacterium]